ncbi:glycosyltransferase family 4 protein [Gordonia polyisoprenivorans]|uniref:glycosyltransferase family 4 protein n=1 Tax=Gordonia polyisoprenivorans TaxID=84595 RepID=UPI0009E38E8A
MVRRVLRHRWARDKHSVGAGDRLEVLHIGLVGDHPGGMAQVVNSYLEYPFVRTEVAAICSASRRHDPFSPLRLVGCLANVLRRKVRARAVLMVVHLSERGSFVREGLILAFASCLGFPTCAHLHGAEFDRFALRHRRLCRLVLVRATSILVLSDETERVVIRFLGIEPVKVRKVGNPVKFPNDSGRSRRSQSIVFGGEVGKRKGVDVLLAAWKEAGPPDDWVLVLAGPISGDFDKSYLSASRVKYLGVLQHQELMLLLEQSEIAVLPSRHEALPMFLLEAMSCGCAVLGTDVGGVSELLSAGAGVVVPAGSVPDLSRALEMMCSSAPIRAALRRSAEEKVRKDLFKVYSQLEAVWLDAAAGCYRLES